MTFWALAYKYQEGVFFDFARDEDTVEMSEKCLLPTHDMAIAMIDEELGEAYTPVKVKIETLSKDGVMTWWNDKVKEWEEA